jgi:hypothetical protein
MIKSSEKEKGEINEAKGGKKRRVLSYERHLCYWNIYYSILSHEYPCSTNILLLLSYVAGFSKGSRSCI